MMKVISVAVAVLVLAAAGVAQGQDVVGDWCRGAGTVGASNGASVVCRAGPDHIR